MKFILHIVFLLVSLQAFSQDTLFTERDTIIDDGKIKVDQVEIIKAFEAKLLEAKMISVLPSPPVVTPKKQTYNYQITIVPIDIIYPDPVIKPLAINPTSLDPGNRFYAKLGYGNLNSPFADVSYHGTRGEDLDYLIYGQFNGLDDSKNLENRTYYDGEVGTNIGYRINENHKLNIGLKGEYDKRYLYDTSLTVFIGDTLGLDRTFIDGSAFVNFSNIETTNLGLDYTIGLKGGYLDADDFNEYRVGLQGSFFKSFNPKFALGIEIDGNIANLNSANEFLHYSTVLPTAKGLIGKISYSIAGDLFYDIDGFSPFVDAEINIPVVTNSLNLFIGSDQKIVDNTLHTRYNTNPFIDRNMPVQTNTIRQQIYGGIKGAFQDVVSYEITAGYEEIKNQRIDAPLRNLGFDQIFDDGNNIFIEGNINININDNLTAGGTVSQNIINLDSLEAPLNLPLASYSVFGQYELWNDRITLRAETFLQDAISWQNFNTGELFTGNAMIDINAELNVKLHEKFGLWVRANNLIDREYIRYWNHPTVGRNFLGGIRVVF